jgi:hypothetical protein
MDRPDLPLTEQIWRRTMKRSGTPVLELSLRRPAFPQVGKAERLERYFAAVAQQWRQRWETVLFPRACLAQAQAEEEGIPFRPWRAQLDYTVTLWEPPLLSLRLDAAEQGQADRPMLSCTGEVWDCATGYPRTLRSFFPTRDRRWRRKLLDALQAQAQARLASGESLLDPDCPQLLARAFDPARFYVTQEGLAIFYPLYVLGPYAEGIPVFTVPRQKAYPFP